MATAFSLPYIWQTVKTFYICRAVTHTGYIAVALQCIYGTVFDFATVDEREYPSVRRFYDVCPVLLGHRGNTLYHPGRAGRTRTDRVIPLSSFFRKYGWYFRRYGWRLVH